MEGKGKERNGPDGMGLERSGQDRLGAAWSGLERNAKALLKRKQKGRNHVSDFNRVSTR